MAEWAAHTAGWCGLKPKGFHQRQQHCPGAWGKAWTIPGHLCKPLRTSVPAVGVGAWVGQYRPHWQVILLDVPSLVH